MYDIFKLPVEIFEPLHKLVKEFELGKKHIDALDTFALDNELFLAEIRGTVLQEIVSSVRSEFGMNLRHKYPALEDQIDEIMGVDDYDSTTVTVLTLQDQRFLRDILSTLEDHAIRGVSAGCTKETRIFVMRANAVEYYIETMMESYFEEERDPAGLRYLEDDEDFYTFALLMTHYMEEEK